MRRGRRSDQVAHPHGSVRSGPRGWPGRLRARLGLTEGQTYVYAIGLAIAVVAAIGGIAPTLDL